MSKTKAQVAILTPLEVEYQAVRHHLTQLEEVRFVNTLYETGCFQGKTRSLRVVISQTGPKNSTLAQAAAEIIQRFQPEVILLTGVAGGVKDVRLGDVVVATQAYGYESGKETAEGFKARPAARPFNQELLMVAKSVARSGAWKKRAEQQGSTAPKVHFGPIASGDKVVATTSSAVYALLKNHYNDTLALEMEAIGFADVVSQYPVVKALNIRGISDLLDHKLQSDTGGSQPTAADHAAAFLFELLAEFDSRIAALPDPLPESSGSRPETTATAPDNRAAASPVGPNTTIYNNGGQIEKVVTMGDVHGNVSV